MDKVKCCKCGQATDVGQVAIDLYGYEQAARTATCYTCGLADDNKLLRKRIAELEAKIATMACNTCNGDRIVPCNSPGAPNNDDSTGMCPNCWPKKARE